MKSPKVGLISAYATHPPVPNPQIRSLMSVLGSSPCAVF